MIAKEGEQLETKSAITATELEELLKTRAEKAIDFVLIDVREKYEHEFNHIVGTDLSMPLSTFYPKVKTLTDKKRSYIIYCNNGFRSESCCKNMRELGYTNALNLLGGIVDYTGETTRSK
jgi:rhodanese-related sulfurtransferase